MTVSRARATLAALLLGLLAGSGGYAQEPAGPVADADSTAQAIAEAEAMRRKAASLGAEWLETGSLIERAEQARDQEKWAEAVKWAVRARAQGELAVGQAEREAEAWRDRVVR